jgi:hypothetical protein
VLAYIITARRGVVKGFVTYIQFNNNSTALATCLFDTIPQYVVISLIVLVFVIVLGFLGIIFYYIYRKFNSIDMHTAGKYQNNYNNKPSPNTYKMDKTEFKKDVSDLDAKILPDEQTAVDAMNKIIELKNKM